MGERERWIDGDGVVGQVLSFVNSGIQRLVDSASSWLVAVISRNGYPRIAWFERYLVVSHNKIQVKWNLLSLQTFEDRTSTENRYFGVCGML